MVVNCDEPDRIAAPAPLQRPVMASLIASELPSNSAGDRFRKLLDRLESLWLAGTHKGRYPQRLPASMRFSHRVRR
jgi:hypothetical protein